MSFKALPVEIQWSKIRQGEGGGGQEQCPLPPPPAADRAKMK